MSQHIIISAKDGEAIDDVYWYRFSDKRPSEGKCFPVVKRPGSSPEDYIGF